MPLFSQYAWPARWIAACISGFSSRGNTRKPSARNFCTWPSSSSSGMAAASPRAPASPRPSGLGPRTHSPVTNNIRQGESGRVRQRHLAQLSSADQKQRSGGTSVTSRANSSRADVQAAYEALYYEGGFDTKEDADDMVRAHCCASS